MAKTIALSVVWKHKVRSRKNPCENVMAAWYSYGPMEYCVDKAYDHAIFQDLVNAPATLQAVQAPRAAVVYGRLPEHYIEVADAEQTYIQAGMKGDPIWVWLTPDARPHWWESKFPHLLRLVCRLKEALSGHPEAGMYWEQKCGARTRSVGSFCPSW